MTIKTSGASAFNPFIDFCIFNRVFENLFYVSLVINILLILIIMYINNELITIKPNNIKIMFYFYISTLIILTLNNNSIVKKMKEQNIQEDELEL